MIEPPSVDFVAACDVGLVGAMCAGEIAGKSVCVSAGTAVQYRQVRCWRKQQSDLIPTVDRR
jgi:hypothetical protein